MSDKAKEVMLKSDNESIVNFGKNDRVLGPSKRNKKVINYIR